MGDVSVQASAQVAFQALPPDVQQAAQDLYTKGQGAVADANQIASFVTGLTSSNDAIKSMQLVAGMVATINPVAGAALAAASGAMGALQAGLTSAFDALGLYDHPKAQGAIGLLPTDSQGFIVWPAPSPDAALTGPSDPRWMHFSGKYTADARCNDYYNQTHATLVTCTYGPGGPGSFPLTGFLDVPISYAEPVYHPESGTTSQPNPNVPEIEKRFGVLMRSNMEFWANAFPFIPPRQLLAIYQAAWNASHEPGTPIHFPYPRGSNGVSYAGPPDQWGNPTATPSLIQMALGSVMDPYATGIDFNGGAAIVRPTHTVPLHTGYKAPPATPAEVAAWVNMIRAGFAKAAGKPAPPAMRPTSKPSVAMPPFATFFPFTDGRSTQVASSADGHYIAVSVDGAPAIYVTDLMSTGTKVAIGGAAIVGGGAAAAAFYGWLTGKGWSFLFDRAWSGVKKLTR